MCSLAEDHSLSQQVEKMIKHVGTGGNIMNKMTLHVPVLPTSGIFKGNGNKNLYCLI